jgi:hypothetical protein
LKRLAFRPLAALAGFLEAELAALLGARVALEETLLLEAAAELRVPLGERARDAVADRLGLGVDAAADDLRLVVERLLEVR